MHGTTDHIIWWSHICNCYCSSDDNNDKDYLISGMRYQIETEIARALEFLHLGGVPHSVIHGDKQDQNAVGTSYLYAAFFIFCTLKGLIFCNPEMIFCNLTLELVIQR